MFAELMHNITNIVWEYRGAHKGTKGGITTNAALGPGYRAFSQAFQASHCVPQAIIVLVLLKVNIVVPIVISGAGLPNGILQQNQTSTGARSNVVLDALGLKHFNDIIGPPRPVKDVRLQRPGFPRRGDMGAPLENNGSMPRKVKVPFQDTGGALMVQLEGDMLINVHSIYF